MAARCERVRGPGEVWDDVRAVVANSAKSGETEFKLDTKAVRVSIDFLNIDHKRGGERGKEKRGETRGLTLFSPAKGKYP